MQDQQTEKDVSTGGGVFQDLFLRIKLILRLMADPRVNFLLKLIPLGSVLYFFFPDLVPGPIDDAAVLWLGSSMFVQLCPPAVVEEHLISLGAQVGPGASRPAKGGPQEEVIDAEWREYR